jgi:hypothetical protein
MPLKSHQRRALANKTAIVVNDARTIEIAIHAMIDSPVLIPTRRCYFL